MKSRKYETMLALLSGLLLSMFAAADVQREIEDALGTRILPPGTELSAHNAILRELCAADKAADDAWRALKSRAEYDAYRARMRERLVVHGALLDYDWPDLLKGMEGK